LGRKFGPPAPRSTPPNALGVVEQNEVLEVLRGRFVDAVPAQAWATLLDEGRYLASESTMYRLLRKTGEVRERRRQATHPPRTIPELVAEKPNEVSSYDVTKLKGPIRGVHYDLFVMLDIYSRYCPPFEFSSTDRITELEFAQYAPQGGARYGPQTGTFRVP
jgi:putative transposase